MDWSRDVATFTRHYFAGEPVDLANRAAYYYWTRKRRLVLDLIRAHFDELAAVCPRSPVFVDLGCGEGIDLAMIATFMSERARSSAPAGRGPDSPWQFIGIEGVPEYVASSRARLAARNIGSAEIRVGNIVSTLPLQDSEVAVLYCSEVVEHIPDVEGIFGEIARVLRPSGYVLMTTPNEPNVFQRSYWSAGYRKRRRATADPIRFRSVPINGELVDIFGHVTLHPAHEWDEIFRRHGFACVDFRRGAATYASYPIMNTAPFYFGGLVFEWILDRLPLTVSRELSDQVVALYRRTA